MSNSQNSTITSFDLSLATLWKFSPTSTLTGLESQSSGTDSLIKWGYVTVKQAHSYRVPVFRHRLTHQVRLRHSETGTVIESQSSGTDTLIKWGYITVKQARSYRVPVFRHRLTHQVRLHHSETGMQLSSPRTATVTLSACKAIKFGEITQNKVIQGHRCQYRSKARMRLSISD